MNKIKIDFVDFWPDIIKTDNYFYNLLAEKYNVTIDSINPDLIFYSCFGTEYLRYKCKRIYFTGENIRPDFTACDFAFSFDFISSKKHFRLPLYSLYIDNHKMNEKIEQLKSKEDLKAIWDKKSKFCCMVVSNPRASKRIDFFKKLSKVIAVDSGGKVLNNVGGRVKNKMEFINDYKFVFAFENESVAGYTTEKILEPIFKDCIPIYWGNPLVFKDFNPERFINYHDFKNEEDLIERLLVINDNPEIALEMLAKPVLSLERPSCLEARKEVLFHINAVIESTKAPAATTILENLHLFKLETKRISKFIKRKVKFLKM